MTKRILFSAIAILTLFPTNARKLTVSADKLPFNGNTDDVTELVVNGNLETGLQFNGDSFKSLKKLIYNGDVQMVGGHSFKNCAELETVVFNGMVGHSDGYCFFSCPKLRSITFNGPVLSTGGEQYLKDCPLVEKVVFNGLVAYTGFGMNSNCPSFNGYEVNGGVVNSSRILPTSDTRLLARKKKLMPQLEKISNLIASSMSSEKGQWMFRIASNIAPEMTRILELYNASQLADSWIKSGKFNDPDIDLDKLSLLKKSASYKPEGKNLDFRYAPPSDSALTATRIRFNLDSVAGDGDDVSRIKNLLHFVHESVRHDGSSQWPDVPFNFGSLYDVCKKENRGVNCRFMAIMLTEVLLAEGIPARYLTCLPKYWETDSDCHVIAAAWSRQLGKWIWVDPTWDTWVTDENGTLLHPGEVRRRLIDGKPLQIAEGANWNHSNTTSVSDYLENYMAKNLYIISCNTFNRHEPEGSRLTSTGNRGNHIALVPEGISYYGNNDTTDEEAFWAAPEQDQ